MVLLTGWLSRIYDNDKTFADVIGFKKIFSRELKMLHLSPVNVPP